MPDSAQAATTGLWTVLVYETRDYLFAAYGPYSCVAHANECGHQAAVYVQPARGGHIDVVPLWRPEDVGKS